MGGACRTHGRDEKGRDYSEDLSIEGKVLLEWSLGK